MLVAGPQVKDLKSPAAHGLDNLLYSADTYFSCFADLALTSPVDYFKQSEGSLLQCVITPAAPYMSWTNEAIAAETDKQVRWLLLFLSDTTILNDFENVLADSQVYQVVPLGLAPWA